MTNTETSQTYYVFLAVGIGRFQGLHRCLPVRGAGVFHTVQAVLPKGPQPRWLAGNSCLFCRCGYFQRASRPVSLSRLLSTFVRLYSAKDIANAPGRTSGINPVINHGELWVKLETLEHDLNVCGGTSLELRFVWLQLGFSFGFCAAVECLLNWGSFH